MCSRSITSSYFGITCAGAVFQSVEFCRGDLRYDPFWNSTYLYGMGWAL